MALRLTLRTLLAYLDNVLSKEDSAILSQKIDESPKASQLKDRIQQTLNRVDLSAESALAEGAHDPNSAAEYLDNTLSEDQISIFEQACLTSEQELAEVADCHRILADVLTRPIQVPPELRERVYRMSSVFHGKGAVDANEHASPASPSTGNGAWKTLGLPGTSGKSKGAPTPPPVSAPSDYGSRGGTRRLTSIFVTVGLFVLFLGILVPTLRPLLRLADQRLPAQPDAIPPEPSKEIAPLPSRVEIERPTERETAIDIPKLSNESPRVAETIANKTETKTAITNLRLEPPESSPPSPVPIPDTPSPDSQPSEPVVADPEKESPMISDIGSLVSEDALLFAQSEAEQPWYRAAKDQVIRGPVSLIAPDSFRSRVILTGGIDLTLIGPTHAVITPTKLSLPRLDLAYGRALIGTSVAEGRFSVEALGTVGVLMMADLRSIAAIEASTRRLPGVDPEKTDASLVSIRLTVVQGEVQWQPADGTPIPLSIGKVLSITNGAKPEQADVGDGFTWIEPPQAASSVEQYARRGLFEKFTSGKASVVSLLRDASTDKKMEVASLAGHTLLQMNSADMFFGNDGLLSRVSQKAYWPDHFLALDSTISRGPAAAQAVREAIQRLNTAEADLLYRLLWSFSNEQLASGDDARLVDSLDHPSLAVRVLALENLRSITGTTLGYRPELEGRRARIY